MNRHHIYGLISLMLVSQTLPLMAQAAPSPYLTQEASMQTVVAYIDTSSELTSSVSGETGASPEVVVMTRASLLTSSEDTSLSTEEKATIRRSKSVTSMATTSINIQRHVNTIMVSDTHISSVSSSKEAVTLSYLIPTKVIGIFPVMVTIRVSVGIDGVVHTTYPWYGFLAPIRENSVKLHSQAAVDDLLHSNESTTATTNSKVSTWSEFSSVEQAAILDSLHSTIQADAKTAVSPSK